MKAIFNLKPCRPNGGYTCTHKVGELAYVDSFSGLVSCKVLEVIPAIGAVKVRVTSAAPGWPVGVTHAQAGRVMPRGHVACSRGGQYRCTDGHTWEN